MRILREGRNRNRCSSIGVFYVDYVDVGDFGFVVIVSVDGVVGNLSMNCDCEQRGEMRNYCRYVLNDVHFYFYFYFLKIF